MDAQAQTPQHKVEEELLIQIRILSPKKTVFSGLASSLTSSNSAGKFDILAQHANFITLIKNTPINIVRDNGEKLSFNFNLAIILAVNNVVTVYTDISDISRFGRH